MYITGNDGRFGMKIHPGLAIFFSLTGLFLFIQSFFVNKKFFEEKKEMLSDTKDMLCNDCKRKYKTEHVQIPVCPICDGKLVRFKEAVNNDTDKPIS